MIGIFSDAHGNGAALRQTIEILKKRGATKFVYLGDAIGYLPSTQAVTVLQELGSDVTCIRGNHEVMLLEDLPGYKREEVYQHNKIKEMLTKEQIDFLNSWPTVHNAEYNGKKALFVHGSPEDHTNAYVYPDTDLSIFSQKYDYVFMGHTGRPFVRKSGDVVYVNVGSCGMPRDDGRYGAAALLDSKADSVKLLRFDITEASAKTFKEIDPLHESVTAVFNRRSESPYGEMTS